MVGPEPEQLGDSGSGSDVSFRTILQRDQQLHAAVDPPACLKDLALDQVFDAIAADRADYAIRDIFNRLLTSPEDITFRQAIVRDLVAGRIRRGVERFCARMATARRDLARAEKHRHPLQKQSRTLEAILAYTDGVTELVEAFDHRPPCADGLRAFHVYLATHAASPSFVALRAEAHAIAEALAGVRFTTLIDGLHVRIEPAAGEQDYGVHLTDLFARFGEGGERGFTFDEGGAGELDMIEERVMEQVARAFPHVFERLACFVRDTGPDFRDATLERFDREVQFYLGYLHAIATVREAGGAFCFPAVGSPASVRIRDGADLALARTVAPQPIISNDVRLGAGERMIVVSGPNQGGKTTFARMIGQIHYLALLGLPVPARAARLQLCDAILTHFERSEVAHSPHGKLQEELVRVHAVLAEATGDSLVILNELFSSTTFRDAYALSADIAHDLGRRNILCVWVTFLDRMTELDPSMVSMVSLVDEEDPTRRTFRIERRAADGMAFARAIAAKYGLTAPQLSDRLAQ